jgi:type II secretory pathway pseudopilin PulG
MKTRGFTLLEILLYIGIVAILLLALSAFLRVVLEARIKNQAIAEVEGQGTAVMQIITQTLRNATALNSPTVGTSAVNLSVNTPIIGLNPTVFDLSGGVLRVTEGANPIVNITSSQVLVTNLLFSNLSAASTKGIMQVRFDISNNSSSTNFEYKFTKTFIGSASLK